MYDCLYRINLQYARHEIMMGRKLTERIRYKNCETTNKCIQLNCYIWYVM